MLAFILNDWPDEKHDDPFHHYHPKKNKRHIEIIRKYNRRRRQQTRSVMMLTLALAFVLWLIIYL
jgi:hypothetical protein